MLELSTNFETRCYKKYQIIVGITILFIYTIYFLQNVITNLL